MNEDFTPKDVSTGVLYDVEMPLHSARVAALTVPMVEGVFTLEQFVVYCARVSNPANQNNMDTAEKLVNYLIKNKHWSPFELASVTIEVVTTRAIAHQIIRHRSAAFQEFSQRYAEAMEFTITECRMQDHKNRQNSLETADDDDAQWWHDAQERLNNLAGEIYKQAIERGIAKECARSVLPEGNTLTRLYIAGSLRTWYHFCQVRTDPSTQKEHRMVALSCAKTLAIHAPSLFSEFVEGNYNERSRH